MSGINGNSIKYIILASLNFEKNHVASNGEFTNYIFLINVAQCDNSNIYSKKRHPTHRDFTKTKQVKCSTTYSVPVQKHLRM